MKCNALQSSLWEIQSLKSHYLCHVSKEVDKLYHLNHTEEYPLDDAFENNSYEEVNIFNKYSRFKTYFLKY